MNPKLVDKGSCLTVKFSVGSIPDSFFKTYGTIVAGGWQGGNILGSSMISVLTIGPVLKSFGWNRDNFLDFGSQVSAPMSRAPPRC